MYKRQADVERSGVEGLALVHKPRDPADIVGNGPACPRGAQRHVEVGVGHLKTATAWPLPPAALRSARPGRDGLHGPTQLDGLWEART
jgi:hypothetical protein